VVCNVTLSDRDVGRYARLRGSSRAIHEAALVVAALTQLAIAQGQRRSVVADDVCVFRVAVNFIRANSFDASEHGQLSLRNGNRLLEQNPDDTLGAGGSGQGAWVGPVVFVLRYEFGGVNRCRNFSGLALVADLRNELHNLLKFIVVLGSSL